MKTKRALVLISLLLLCINGFSQTAGYKKAEKQIGYSALDLRYGNDTYHYTFSVRDGIVSWNYSGPNGKKKGNFHCNKAVDGDIIASECKGVVYWYFAGWFVWEMVEENNRYDDILYKRSMQALEFSIAEFKKGKKTSFGAYERARDAYLEIKASEAKGQSALWDTLVLYSYALNEHEMRVSDLYDYNF